MNLVKLLERSYTTCNKVIAMNEAELMDLFSISLANAKKLKQAAFMQGLKHEVAGTTNT